MISSPRFGSAIKASQNRSPIASLNSTGPPTMRSWPAIKMSVSPQAALTSRLTVASSESPTTKEDVMMAEEMTSPAIIKADWRFRRTMFSRASLQTSKRWGRRSGCTKSMDMIPSNKPPTRTVREAKPSQSNTTTLMAASAGPVNTNSSRFGHERSRVRDDNRRPTMLSARTTPTTSIVQRNTPIPPPEAW